MTGPVTPELLERLLNEHAAALELFASQWTDTPEDCVQEAFIQLVRQKRIPERIAPWLFRVVRNGAISQRRAAQRRRRHESAAANERPSWFQTSENTLVDDDALTEALRSLGDTHREVIVARIWGGLSYEQVAEVIGISRSSAHRRYETGLGLLRERLSRHLALRDESCQRTALGNCSAEMK